jgi:hypothetical protein
MTKKHFIALADAIKTATVQFTREHLEVLAGFCSAQNWRFNRDRWLGYIRGKNGPNGGSVPDTHESLNAVKKQ